jgi:hypothetical protein
MTREPVVLALLPAVLTEAGGAVLLLANDHTTYGLLVAAATFLTGVGGVLARSRVSPIDVQSARFR